MMRSLNPVPRAGVSKSAARRRRYVPSRESVLWVGSEFLCTAWATAAVVAVVLLFLTVPELLRVSYAAQPWVGQAWSLLGIASVVLAVVSIGLLVLVDRRNQDLHQHQQIGKRG